MSVKEVGADGEWGYWWACGSGAGGVKVVGG